MKTGLKYISKKFHVDGNRVTCVLRYDIEERLGSCSPVIACAKCHPDDKFDLTEGKKIALTRAQAKAFNEAKQYYSNVMKVYQTYVNEYEKLIAGCEDAKSKCLSHANELIDKLEK